MSKILITGINGFIGSHIARKVLEDGHMLRGLVRRKSDLKLIRDLDIELITGDITDESSLGAAVKGIDIVIHVAGLASDWGAYEDFFNVNYSGTRNIGSIANNAGVKRMVLISSVAIHGFGFRNITENYPSPNDLNNYSKTKKLAEDWFFDYGRNVPMEVTALRPGNVYGPDDFTFMDKYLKSLCSGTIGQIDNGEKLTCPTYVENLSDAVLISCFEKKAVGEAFFITDGLFITWREFNEKLTTELGVKMPAYSIPYWLGDMLAYSMESVYKLAQSQKSPFLTRYRIANGGMDYHFSIDKAKRLLNWEPRIDINEAVKRTVLWFKEIKN